MRILYAVLAGFVLDLLLGDPAWIFPIHPVVLMGRAISKLETALRARFPKTDRGELLAGLLLVLAMLCGTALLSWGSLALLERLWPPLAFAEEPIRDAPLAEPESATPTFRPDSVTVSYTQFSSQS